MPSTRNPCLEEVHATLPRLLALFDADPTSPSYGWGDRFHWGWKLIDFPNATFQGAAHGLARLVHAGLLPGEFRETAMLRRIGALFDGTRRLTRGDGSLEEAFPFEGSFCVTALVAYDLLATTALLADRIGDETRYRWLDTIRPLIGFLQRHDETHAFISNHLATASAALLRWSDATGGEGETHGRALLDRILRAQSTEGWLREYDGADPGYQSLATYYLADIHHLRPDLGLAGPLARSLQFLWWFAHPDGSFGGLYGSRNTRFYCPAGVEALAAEVPQAAALARFMRNSIAGQRVPTLRVLDAPNLVPFFNAYCWAAVLVEARIEEPVAPKLPARERIGRRLHLPEAGLLIDQGPDHYTIISTHKGGVCCHFGGESRIDAGVVLRDPRGRLYSTQAFAPGNAADLSGDTLTVRAPFTRMTRRLPGPWRFILLRLLNVTVMRLSGPRDWIKRLLVRLLITGKHRIAAENLRTIRLGPELAIDDHQAGHRPGLERWETDAPFSAIHMAGQGYWQIQDEQ